MCFAVCNTFFLKIESHLLGLNRRMNKTQGLFPQQVTCNDVNMRMMDRTIYNVVQYTVQ